MRRRASSRDRNRNDHQDGKRCRRQQPHSSDTNRVVQASPARWPVRILAVFLLARAAQAKRAAASSALDADSRGRLEVQAGAADGEFLSGRRVRNRDGLLLKPAVKLLAACRARRGVRLELLRWLSFPRSFEELLDVRVWSLRRRGLRPSLASEMAGGNHQRGHEILRRRRAKVPRQITGAAL
jgi:hypothetical protein